MTLAQESPATVRAGALADSIKVEPLTCAIGAVVSNVHLGVASRSPDLVAEIRAALGDRARAPRFIRTAHGFGYAFCGEATVFRSPAAIQTQITCWLEWGTRRFGLSPGDNVVGRDPDVEIQLDSSTVSRRHARVVVRADGAKLEDAGSKNGTFLGEARVTSAVRLSDGDLIHIGSFVVAFRARGQAGTTQTHRKGR